MQVAVPRSRNVAMRVRYYPPRAGNELRPAGNGTQDVEGLTWRCRCQGSSTLDAPGGFESSLREYVLPGRKGEKEEERAKR